MTHWIKTETLKTARSHIHLMLLMITLSLNIHVFFINTFYLAFSIANNKMNYKCMQVSFSIRLVCLFNRFFATFEFISIHRINTDLKIWILKNVFKKKPKPRLPRNNTCRVNNFTLVVFYLISQSASWFSENQFLAKNYVNNKWQKWCF